MRPDEQMVLELTEFDWVIACAAVETAEISRDHVGAYDVLEEKQDASPFTGLAIRLNALLATGELTLRVSDQEFTLLLIAVERSLFLGLRTSWIQVKGNLVYLESAVSHRQQQDAVQALFARLRQIPHRPTVVLDGGAIV